MCIHSGNGSFASYNVYGNEGSGLGRGKLQVAAAFHSLLLGGIRSMMGGSRHGFGDANAMGERATGESSSMDQSGSSLARDAGINNIGSSGNRADDSSRAGLFDSASNDDDHDDMDLDSDDVGGDGDSDLA